MKLKSGTDPKTETLRPEDRPIPLRGQLAYAFQELVYGVRTSVSEMCQDIGKCLCQHIGKC